ncbi:MAG: methyltransferase domain-containing protein [Candidatus Geothermincolales bacterium]
MGRTKESKRVSAKEKHIGGFPHALVVKGSPLQLELAVSAAGSKVTLGIDIYSSGPHVHPERHLGYRVFLLPAGKTDHSLLVRLNLYGDPGEFVSVEADGMALEPVEGWHNPDFVISPVLDVALVVTSDDRELERVQIPCYVHDGSLLERYYAQETHQEAYSGEGNVFLDVFHRERIRILGRLFRRYFDGARKVLDVGSGYSMFRCISPGWPFQVTCCDLDEPALQVIREESPEYQVVIADAASLPFEDGAFDGLFAGEILEHVVEPERALREWVRVVRPGGILIVTTPNAARLMNRINRSRDPVNPEHLNELTYRELWRLFEDEGLRVLYSRGIHLEFLFNYFRRGKKIDLIATRFNRPAFRPLIRFSMALGALARPFAYNLVFVLKKPDG